MAVKIPIITVFDSKGLRQAQFQLNKVRGNFQNLGRNFAIAGAAFAGATAVIVKSAQALARIESINAQTAQTIKSMGNAANVSAKEVETLAGSLEAMTATEAEAIQEGANLLLTFGNITNQLGKGNDIFNQTTAIMVDMGVALKKGPVDTATMLGKALNDPIRGMTALRRVGVSFTDQQVEQVKALQQSGDLMGAQKLILAELQNQYGGSGAAFAATFAGQVQLLNHELGALGEEATMVVMPALQSMVGELRALAPEIGTKLSAAIASVDWKAFTKTLVDTITFLVQNAEAITKVVTALFVLNTTYNVVKAASGLFNFAAVILGKTFVVTAGQIGLATGAVKLFRTALITTGIGALVVGLGFIIEAIINTNNASKDGTPTVTNYGGALRKSGADAEWAAQRYGIAAGAARDLASATRGIATNADRSSFGPTVTGIIPQASFAPTTASINAGKKSAKKTVSVAKNLRQELQKEEKKQAAFVRLTEKKGLSEGLATQILGGSKPLKTAASIVRGTKKAAKDLQSIFNNTAAGQQEAANRLAEETAQAAEDLRKLEQAQAEAARQGAEALAEFNRQQEEIARQEQAILDERERVYKSFADSVSSTFSKIKDDILGAFSLPQMGGSTDAIIRNMDKLLTRVKAFSGNITRLSSMGLDPKLLQQVINAGPIAGAKLAANLVAGGVGGLSAINRGYAELGNVAGEIGMTGTQALFGTQAQQTVYNVNINGGLDSGASIGKAVVDAVKAYERASGPVWQGA